MERVYIESSFCKGGVSVSKLLKLRWLFKDNSFKYYRSNRGHHYHLDCQVFAIQALRGLEEVICNFDLTGSKRVSFFVGRFVLSAGSLYIIHSN